MKSYTGDTLYMVSKNGKVKEWSIKAYSLNKKEAIIKLVYGYVDGKKQINEKIVYKGKNIGRSNETTPLQQAIKESQSKHKKQLEKGYTTSPDGISNVKLPMLAATFNDSKHHIKYPCAEQGKLNGVRCLGENPDLVIQVKKTCDGINFTSKTGKSYNKQLSHLVPYLTVMMSVGDIFDGEIYVHGWTFQQIIRAVKKLTPESSELQFWVYDLAIENVKYIDRLKMLQGKIPKKHEFIKLHSTGILNNEEEVKPRHDEHVKNGFEGIILRNYDGLYVFNHRSLDMQKFKVFFDKEVIIIGGKADKEGCVVFRVKDEQGNEFSSRPRGSRESRRKWLKEINSLIGKQLTIRYQELSEDGVPIFNVGIAIRDYE